MKKTVTRVGKPKGAVASPVVSYSTVRPTAPKVEGNRVTIRRGMRDKAKR